MKITEVKDILKGHSLVVEIRPTKELFPYSTESASLTHFSVVCRSHADQHRVNKWIEFIRPDFEDFDCWAAYVEAITDNGIYTDPEERRSTYRMPNLNLPPGVGC